MNEYRAIMKTINDKLAEQQSVIEYYREEKEKTSKVIDELHQRIFALEMENKQLKEKIDDILF